MQLEKIKNKNGLEIKYFGIWYYQVVLNKNLFMSIGSKLACAESRRRCLWRVICNYLFYLTSRPVLIKPDKGFLYRQMHLLLFYTRSAVIIHTMFRPCPSFSPSVWVQLLVRIVTSQQRLCPLSRKLYIDSDWCSDDYFDFEVIY